MKKLKILGYLAHSWQIVKRNKLFSGVYILGTALAIAMVMAYAISWCVSITEIYPEVNRGRSLYMGYLAELSDDGGCRSSSMSSAFVRTVIPEELLGKEIECVAEFDKYESDEDILAYSALVRGGIPVTAFYTTPDICKVFEYEFLYGAPFTTQDMVAKARKVFITRSYARKLFGTENAVGMPITVNFTEFIVCGVIRDVSRITSVAYANVWLPLSLDPDFDEEEGFGDTQMLGAEKAIILARSAADFSKIKAGIAANMKRLNNSLQGVRLENYGQPDEHFRSLFRTYSNSFPDIEGNILKGILLLAALLLVPAVNLSGIIASGMEDRLEELGIRKAFGASRGKLMSQIICENFLLTFMGGVLGLIISYLIILTSSNWLMQLVGSNSFFDRQLENADFIITPSMLFNPYVFLIALLVCMILNILAASVPAYISLRKNIVDSLTVDKK